MVHMHHEDAVETVRWKARIVDAAFLPTSAAVNPALTIAAQALRVADHIIAGELA